MACRKKVCFTNRDLPNLIEYLCLSMTCSQTRRLQAFLCGACMDDYSRTIINTKIDYLNANSTRSQVTKVASFKVNYIWLLVAWRPAKNRPRKFSVAGDHLLPNVTKSLWLVDEFQWLYRNCSFRRLMNSLVNPLKATEYNISYTFFDAGRNGSKKIFSLLMCSNPEKLAKFI